MHSHLGGGRLGNSAGHLALSVFSEFSGVELPYVVGVVVAGTICGLGTNDCDRVPGGSQASLTT